jgi:hypothetical protein
MHSEYKPRFSFEIDESQQLRANRLLSAYGMRKAIFGKLLDEVLDIIEEYGDMAIGMMSSNITPLKEILPTMKKTDQVGKIVKEKTNGRS